MSSVGSLLTNLASSHGDLALSPNGHFIGVLSDITHAVVMNAFLAGAILDAGPRFHSQAIGGSSVKMERKPVIESQVLNLHQQTQAFWLRL